MKLATLLTVAATTILGLTGHIAAVPLDDLNPIPSGRHDSDLPVDKTSASNGLYFTALRSRNASIIVNPRNSPEGQECLEPLVPKCCKHNMGDYHKYCRDGKHWRDVSFFLDCEKRMHAC